MGDYIPVTILQRCNQLNIRLRLCFIQIGEAHVNINRTRFHLRHDTDSEKASLRSCSQRHILPDAAEGIEHVGQKASQHIVIGEAISGAPRLDHTDFKLIGFANVKHMVNFELERRPQSFMRADLKHR